MTAKRPLFTLTARHGDSLKAADLLGLQVIRRTLVGLLSHGFITELEQFSGEGETEWSFRAGTDPDGAGILAGLVDTARVMVPTWWALEASGPGVAESSAISGTERRSVSADLYRKKPVVIEARRNDATGYREDENGTYGAVYALAGWCGGHVQTGGSIVIPTLEGDMVASPGDWIIRGVAGEFYPCKPDIFEATYEPA